MRIAVLQLEILWSGGIEKFLTEVLTRMGPGNPAAVFTFRYDPTALPEREGFEVRVVGQEASLDGHLRTYYRYRRIGKLLTELKSWRPDVVIVHQAEGIRLANWLSSELDGVPIIPYVHDVYALKASGQGEQRQTGRLRGALLNGLANGVYKSADLGGAGPVACVSRFIQGKVSESWSGVETRVIHNGVDHGYYSPTWEDEGFALCVSRLDRTKNLDLLLDNFYDAAYPVIICGNVLKGDPGFEYSRFMQDLLRRAKKPIEVRMNPDEAQVRRLFQTASIFLHPSKDEGFGLSPVEAMACGKPVIAHRSGGTLEAVGDGGILLGDDGREWRRKADELMASPRARRRLGEKALDYSMRFSWEKTAGEILEMCEDAVAKKGRGLETQMIRIPLPLPRTAISPRNGSNPPSFSGDGPGQAE